MAIIALIALYFAARLALIGSGYFSAPSLREILLFSALIIILNSSKKLFYFVLMPILAVYALYAPIGLSFGAPSYQYIASVFATDLLEGKEFLSQLPFINYLLPVAIIALVLFFRFCTQKYRLYLHKNKVFLAAVMIFALFDTVPFKLLQDTYHAGMKVSQELTMLNNLSIESQWGKSSLRLDSGYDDYVVIIGESARKDYHHAYGYPVENTPFMSSAKGTLIDGFTAGGTNTIASLKLMLTKPDTQQWEGDYGLNFIDLVKSAGIKTYWISNQGYLGQFDTPISAIANKSDEKIFLKAGDSLNTNTSDFQLLPKFTQVIAQPFQGKRFIVLHLYGSHPITCDRLTDYPKLFNDNYIAKKYFNVNCYISSIKKTDEVLRQVYESLRENQQKNHRTFSMIYFSDHGLAHQISEDNIVIHNSNGRSKRHYDVPLFKISSDDTQRREYRVFKSGLNFTDGIANWIGIDNPKINSAADLFSNNADPDDYGLSKIIEKIDSSDDPAVVIPTP
ncbi:phosphoethanolamine transferase [Caviibacterium pharyngocola]|uniref:Sulfatase N-terminal domain-containing protein n=1 Tax=Caviibacterium pharyngocola TaxID=28159 RepID=A0A2M8RSM9_9PAST|nr:phosphoethanolamine transferase [Caviibacterium pharyngocola]PJG81891.1 hypothetical protein CVP04_12110 [Caviibacterium pharyngocola]